MHCAFEQTGERMGRWCMPLVDPGRAERERDDDYMFAA